MTDSISPDRVQEIRVRWSGIPTDERPQLTVTNSSRPGSLIDALAHAREDVPWLLDRVDDLEAGRDAAVAAAASHTLAKMTELRDRLKAMNDPARSGVSLAIHLVRALTDDTAETPAREQDYDVVKRVLTELNVAWIDPHCGHPRSPDTEFMSPCPDPGHDTA